MPFSLALHRMVILCLGFAPALFGQIDASQLREKYGAPLARETFTISPGFEIVVHYGPNQQVCRLELPAAAVDQAGVRSSQRVDVALLELVPMSMRGKELGAGFDHAARASIKFTDYERISIVEPQDPDHPGRRTGVNVVFKREDCQGR